MNARTAGLFIGLIAALGLSATGYAQSAHNGPASRLTLTDSFFKLPAGRRR
ncbi:MAG: hypothetical protein ACJ0SL_02320 [Candidatus Rariloculaceae bacterium]